ncbi:hypothetical protein H2199_001127 [Coniosporium tulheliwenetii]|uniref:Uncharacterized protein n=1 Tax=Coniosporium tulheliwenetii TaxID=3383036 RepID=A0ACC2ZL49_9PEZI|nr:hypothetical protein H2199_001127 [Cladosporium sp. JES 115]
MLCKTNGEEGGIKTVTLARGTFTGASPPAVTSDSRIRGSIDRTGSSDGREKNDILRILGQVGIVELLEQDQRPTFVVDLGDANNYGPGPLQIIFANACLRTSPALMEMVSGRSTSDSPGSFTARAFSSFKSWVLSSVSNGEALDVCLPPYTHGSIIWSCSILRRRFRVVSGSPSPSSLPSSNDSQINSAENLPTSSTATFSSSEALESTSIPSVPSAPMSERQDAGDYFGDAAPPPTSDISAPDVVMPSVESPGPKVPKPTGWTRKGFVRGQDVSALDSQSSLMNECVLQVSTEGDVNLVSRNPPTTPPHEVGFFDWTRLPVSANLPRHIQFARSIDWESTPLGPIELWSSDLRQMCNLIMASPHPAAMYWGDDLVAIYNEAYVMLAGQKHPKLMGQRYREAWVEIWDDVKEVFANARSTGQATMKDDDRLFIKRSNYLEETYFSWSIIPMVGGDGTVMGLYNPAFEKTRRKIAERRMLTLREVGERTAAARDVRAFWEQVLAALDTNEYDTPFVLLYSVSDDNDSDSSSIYSSSLVGTKQCYLEGALGVEKGHRSAPEQIDLKTGMEGFGPVFREVMKTDKPVLLEIGTGDLPSELMENLEWRGFGDPCRAVVVCPVHPTTGDSSVLGFLVMGVNPRRPYDDDYSLFIQLLSRQLATSLASVVLFEEEIRRGQKAAKLAAQDRIELSQQLAARTQEAKDSETRFTRMAEFSPAGLFIADSDGHITYCNDTWYDITRVAKNPYDTDNWIDAVKDEDQAMVRRMWFNLVENTEPITVEFRFKAPWEDRNGNKGETWVLFSAYPEKTEQGFLKSVFGSITNISSQKWAEGWQKRKMEEAYEIKHAKPLSAILQCADEIAHSLIDFRNSKSDRISEELVNDTIDAAQTISLCACHQKRIVDDVLTLSKLDSAMLLVTPVDVQPLDVVSRALKMFEGELATADIQMKFVVDESFKKLGIDWVRIDPSRVLQVLINLTTNAIKFTTTEKKRTITVTVAASTQKPSEAANRVVDYFPTRSKRVDMTQGSDWGTGDEVYVQFAVQDTGRGLTEEEKKVLFLRFSQASPRTHVQYGGSGLGLFISRELTELQGGEIGVASEAGKGSTFAFYVKARRSSAPKDFNDQLPLALKNVEGKNNRTRIETKTKTKDFAPTASKPLKSQDAANNTGKDSLKVLIVEDNLVNQRVLQKQLKNQGFATYVANHGGEALDQLRASNFWHDHGKVNNTTNNSANNKSGAEPLHLNVVLMDQEMPVMDGLQCTKRIREWEESGLLVRHVPIIAVTANARAEQIEALVAAGMDDVVSKPFRIPELVPKIEELAARYAEGKSQQPNNTTSASAR